MENTLYCVLQRIICAKEIASYLVGALALAQKAKVGQCAREAQKVTGEQKCECLSIPSAH